MRVTRIHSRPQVEGVVFFLAHTKDDENKRRGGSIVVALLEDKASSFVRKYGDTIEINRSATEKVASKRLHSIFHVLDHGHVYIDASGGEAHDAILTNVETAKDKIGRGDPTRTLAKGKITR